MIFFWKIKDITTFMDFLYWSFEMIHIENDQGLFDWFLVHKTFWDVKIVWEIRKRLPLEKELAHENNYHFCMFHYKYGC